MTGGQWSIRRLGRDDLAAMRDANRLFGEAFEDPERYKDAPPDDAHLRALLAAEHFIAVVADIGERVVGAAAGYELVKFERAAREIYLYDIAVDADHRRQGIATALIEQLRAIAVQRGAEVVFVQADGDDPEAVSLYATFTEARTVFHFDILPGTGAA